MSKTRAAEQRTRGRLIDAATRLFATRGYRYVSVRAICRDAHANVAAVNYHFRNKFGLYTEVLEAAAAVIRELTDAAVRAGEGRSPEDQVRAYIRVHCERIFEQGETNLLQQLIYRETQDPTPALESLLNRAFRPRFEYLNRVVGRYLDLPPDDERVVLCAISIHTLIVTLRPNPVLDRFGGKLKRLFTVERISEHITAFSMGAMDSYRSAGSAGSNRLPA